MPEFNVSEVNPFVSLGNAAGDLGSSLGVIAGFKKQLNQPTHYERSMAMIAANHHATTLHTAQQAQLAEEAAASAHARSEAAADAAHGRRQEFFNSAMKHVAPGSNFTLKLDNQVISGVKRAGTKRTAPAPEAPVKPKTPPRARTPKG